jgi:hypothetical protein
MRRDTLGAATKTVRQPSGFGISLQSSAAENVRRRKSVRSRKPQVSSLPQAASQFAPASRKSVLVFQLVSELWSMKITIEYCTV